MSLFDKKPWDYNNPIDRMKSIKDDYNNDAEVLKRVIKEDIDIDVKSTALICIMFLSNEIKDLDSLLSYLAKLDIHESEAKKILKNIEKRISEMKAKGILKN